VPVSPRERREQYPVTVFAVQVERPLCRPLSGLDPCSRVCQTSHQADHHRDAIALGDLERLTRHVVGLLLVGRLETGNVCEVGEPATVLFVLRAVHPGVVGHGQHESTAGRDDSGVDERVCGDVQPDVFHRDQHALAGHRDTERFFVGGLLVGTPRGQRAAFALGMLQQVLQDLGRGGAGIGVSRRDSGVHRAQRDGLVPQQDLLFGGIDRCLRSHVHPHGRRSARLVFCSP